MKLLFIHQNFPGQFVSMAPALAQAGHEVRALTYRQNIGGDCRGVEVRRLKLERPRTQDIQHWLPRFEDQVIRGEATQQAAKALRAEGFEPDAIILHPGWGDGLFLREVWPRTRLGIYAEFYFAQDQDAGPGPGPPASETFEARTLIRVRNLPWRLGFQDADLAISPTRYQADQFPPAFRDRIEVIHDGVDTDLVSPDLTASLLLRSGVRLTADDEVITFINRNLEPVRGYHVFMRALPEVLRRRPRARVIIIGGNESGYGGPPPPGQTWKDIYRNELWPKLTDDQKARVHFIGKVPYQDYLNVLRVSSVHVYLTTPFVLGWSLMEAMSAGCAVVGSDTAPVTEMITHDETGRLVDFSDVAGLAEQICDLLADPEARRRLGAQAREHIVANYDRARICLPAQLDWALRLARG